MVAISVVDDSDDRLVITDDGTIIRVAVAGISERGRSTSGVRIMRPVGDAKVICIEKTERFAQEEEDGSEDPAEETDAE